MTTIQEWYYTLDDQTRHIQQSKNKQTPRLPWDSTVGPFNSREEAFQSAKDQILAHGHAGKWTFTTFRREPYAPDLHYPELSSKVALMALMEIQNTAPDNDVLPPGTDHPPAKGLDRVRAELQQALQEVLPAIVERNLRWSTMADWVIHEIEVTPADLGYGEMNLAQLLAALNDARNCRNWKEASRIESAVVAMATETIKRAKLPFEFQSFARDPDNPWSPTANEPRLHILTSRNWSAGRFSRPKGAALCQSDLTAASGPSSSKAKICVACFTRLASLAG